jgi:dihydroorotase
VLTALLMRRALEYTSMCGMPVIDHCEDPTLKGDGVAHEGFNASRLGLKGIPGEAEELWIERDITLAGLTGGRFHVAHLSTRGSLRAVRNGKSRGINVTCEVAPHHFILTDDALEGYDTNVKMNPPLREAADRDELVRGIVDGSVDVIATDHAPHHADEKRVEFDRAPFGIVGPRNLRPADLRSPGPPRPDHADALRRAAVGEPGPDPRRRRRRADAGRGRRRVDPGARSRRDDRSRRRSCPNRRTRRSAAGR